MNAANLLVKFIFISQYWSRGARRAFFVAAPITFPLWLVGLALWIVLGTIAYVLVLLLALVSLALTESGVISHFISSVVRTCGVDGFDVMENHGRVNDPPASYR